MIKIISLKNIMFIMILAMLTIFVNCRKMCNLEKDCHKKESLKELDFLKLTDDQKKALEDFKNTKHEEMKKHHSAMIKSFSVEFEKETLDKTKLLNIMPPKENMMNHHHENMVETIAALHKILTPEQRKMFMEKCENQGMSCFHIFKPMANFKKEHCDRK